MDSRVVKIVVGLAVKKAYFERPESVPKLAPLWEEPMREAIQRSINDFLSSDVIWERTTAFRLQAAIQEDLPDPDPIAWRDLALDIMDQVPYLVDFMYRVGQQAEQESENTINKRILNDAYKAFQGWQAALNECVDEMRRENWTEAKAKIDLARDISTDPTFAGLLTLDPKDWKMTVDGYRERTVRFHEKVLAFPSRIDIPSQRIDLILETLTALLRLLELDHRFFQDDKIRNTCGYATQTVGQTLEYLLTADEHVKSARWELDLGISHLYGTMNAVKNEEIHSQLQHIYKDLCVLRNKLPVP